MINKYKYYAASLLLYSALIIYYQPPFGLMDDFKNIEHIQNLNQDFFGYYMAYFYEEHLKKVAATVLSSTNVFSIFFKLSNFCLLTKFIDSFFVSLLVC